MPYRQSTASTPADFIDTPIGRIPATRKCPYCGRPLKTTSVTVMGRTYSNLPCFGSCGCEKSRQYESRTALTSERKRCPECGYMVPVAQDGICSCACGFTFVAKSTLDERNDELQRINEALWAESMGGLMAASGVPEMYRDVDADLALAQEIARSGKGRFLCGGPGTFKTVKAAEIAKGFLDMGKSVMFAAEYDLVARFRESMNGGDQERAVLAEVAAADLLVIDDLGKENPTPWTVSTLFKVIDTRLGSTRPLVVTSNYTLSELVARFASGGEGRTVDSTLSRLAEMTEPVDFGNTDNRFKQ